MDGHRSPQDGPAHWYTEDAGDIDAFRRLIAIETKAGDWNLARAVRDNVPLYDGADVATAANSASERQALLDEWHRAFSSGPGVIVISGAVDDGRIVDRATQVFEDIIEAERATGGGGGDHFAKPGANDRVWNSAEKHCLADPSNFADYFANDTVALASEAWLGPGYQVTAQVNRVNPGGKAQVPHRDYHLGFMGVGEAISYPKNIHALSPLLTLQGAIAQCDMPVDSGPTMLLPYSHQFAEGYVAFGRDAFQDAFADRAVQLPLNKGDAVFFNPALMHGAGTNFSQDIRRMANLLQVGSAFGRSIETVNRTRMVKCLYPVLQGRLSDGTLSEQAARNVIAASAEGYAFPTNLDNDLPTAGLAPRTQARRMWDALETGMSALDFSAEMDAYDRSRRS